MSNLQTEGIDDDLLGPRFELAVDNEDWSGLAAMVSYYRARAARAEGKAEGLAETIAYLKHRIVLMESREAGAPAAPALIHVEPSPPPPIDGPVYEVPDE